MNCIEHLKFRLWCFINVFLFFCRGMMVSTTGGMRTTGVEGGMKVTEEEMTGELSFTFEFLNWCLIQPSLLEYELTDGIIAGVVEGQLSEKRFWMVSILLLWHREKQKIQIQPIVTGQQRPKRQSPPLPSPAATPEATSTTPRQVTLDYFNFALFTTFFLLRRRNLEKVVAMRQGLKELLKESVVGEEKAGEGGRLDLLPGVEESEGHDRPLNQD